MREAHAVERAVGMEYYVSDAPGVGGHLRERPEDFRVTEVEAVDPEPLDSDPGGYANVLARVMLRQWDTNDFAGELSDRLGISRERVSWAGTKDKHAVTTQLFTVGTIDPEELRAVEIRDAEMELLGRTGRPVLFGDLAGNGFEIVVRDAESPEDAPAITDDLRAFARGGEDSDRQQDTPAGTTVSVPNYFGQQRFGSKRPVTHEVGLEIVRGNWRGAVLSYVGSPAEREPESTREARRYVDRELRSNSNTSSGDEPRDETEDWEGALDRLPRRLGFERSMCHRLVERSEDGSELDDEDYRAALEAVPSNLQRLFVNAAQSYAFNRILSARLDRGLPFHEPVAGDVVCFSDADAPGGFALPDTDRTQRVTEDRLRTVRRHCERGRAFVTAPLIGTDTELADGEPGEIERAVLDDLDLSPADFDLPGEFESTGTRRAVLLRTALTVERGVGNNIGDIDNNIGDVDGVDGTPTDPDSGEDALTFEFALPKGSYATVVLREYLKRDPDDL